MSDLESTDQPSELQSADLSLVAALAAISFDYAATSRTADQRPVECLVGLLRDKGTPTASAKKALARLADSPDLAEVKSGKRRGPDTKSTTIETSYALKQLGVAAQNGVAALSKDDLVTLREFCIRLSIVARRPRPSSPLRLP